MKLTYLFILVNQFHIIICIYPNKSVCFLHSYLLSTEEMRNKSIFKCACKIFKSLNIFSTILYIFNGIVTRLF
jgi:hypothetical protein